jgi:opacity protein-like surface antigen
MKRFLTVLIASMFLASAAIAAEKLSEEKEKKAPAAEGKGDTKEKKATKGDKKAAKDETTDKMKEDKKTK